jgi:putative glutamine amidotransferase
VRDRFEIALIHEALRRRLPILGICRGCQLLNVALGGTLRTIRSDKRHRRYHNRLCAHGVALLRNSRLCRIVRTRRLWHIRSLHGQAVARPGRGLKVVARASDGVAEAIEHRATVHERAERPWIIGVQWHPELMPFKNQEHRLIDAFVRRAAWDARRTRETSGDEPAGNQGPDATEFKPGGA